MKKSARKASPVPRFSLETLRFLEKAGRARSPEWLERNHEEFDRCVREPLKYLAQELKRELAPVAPGYHFPQKGIGRLKRPAHRVEEYGGLFRSWLSYSASIPAESRFDHNPNLYFLINTEDRKDPVLVAGGLYMPSSRQLRSIREAIAEDATAFDQLFASREFQRSFKGGFSDERKSRRPPRGFDPSHPRIEWLKLQAYFVWRPYSRKEFSSKEFPSIVARDFRQILRLNELLQRAIQGRLPKAQPVTGLRTRPPRKLEDRLEGISVVPRKMDF